MPRPSRPPTPPPPPPASTPLLSSAISSPQPLLPPPHSASSAKVPETMKRSANDFHVPTQHLRKQRRKERLLGKRAQDVGSRFRGAPLPRRQLFIYRVLPETTCEDILSHVSDLNLNVDVYDVKPVSHVDAKFKSFVLTCNVDGFKRLLNADLWPEGCGVRKFNPPKGGKDAKTPASNRKSQSN